MMSPGVCITSEWRFVCVNMFVSEYYGYEYKLSLSCVNCLQHYWQKGYVIMEMPSKTSVSIAWNESHLHVKIQGANADTYRFYVCHYETYQTWSEYMRYQTMLGKFHNGRFEVSTYLH